jgi:hypothetical protein
MDFPRKYCISLGGSLVNILIRNQVRYQFEVIVKQETKRNEPQQKRNKIKQKRNETKEIINK